MDEYWNHNTAYRAWLIDIAVSILRSSDRLQFIGNASVEHRRFEDT